MTGPEAIRPQDSRPPSVDDQIRDLAEGPILSMDFEPSGAVIISHRGTPSTVLPPGSVTLHGAAPERPSDDQDEEQ